VSDGELAGLALGDLVAMAGKHGPDAEVAWRLIVDRHLNLVWKVVRCFGLSKEASEEAFQSTWLRAIERLGTLRDPECFPGWLSRIARNEALAVIRTRHRMVPSAHLPDQPADEPHPGDRMQRDELGAAVREGLACLPRACQDLLRLLAVDPPVPYREIEELLDMTHGSIGPTRRRCLNKLRETPPMVAFLAGMRE